MARPRKRATKRKAAKAKPKKVRKAKKRFKGGARKAAKRAVYGGTAAPDFSEPAPLEAFEGERPTTNRPPVGRG